MLSWVNALRKITEEMGNYSEDRKISLMPSDSRFPKREREGERREREREREKLKFESKESKSSSRFKYKFFFLIL